LAIAGVLVLAAAGAAVAVVTHPQAAAKPAGPPPPPVHVAVRGLHDGRVPWSGPLTVRVSDGTLVAVQARDSAGQLLPGRMSPTNTAWRSRLDALIPLTTYRLTVLYANEAHRLASTSYTVQATDSQVHLIGLLDPGGGDTVGIGQPVIVYFNNPVPDTERAAVERRLTVTASPATVGAWHWVNQTEVHWRPKVYWKTGTTVTVHSDLAGLYLGNGMWGDAQPHSTTFKIGDAHISVADINQHVMTVYDNGKIVQVFKISAGRTRYPTKEGIHIVLNKTPVIQMISSTVGIPVNSPDGYDETVYWDTRISDGGEFVHAAPWSLSAQGVVNVSHGCINVSPANAQWFYYWSQRGDIVDVTDGGAPTDLGDPGMEDWNLTWSQWLAG
jgi:lipoprotein-anchoring transpeptidase ErfK/SrfK